VDGINRQRGRGRLPGRQERLGHRVRVRHGLHRHDGVPSTAYTYQIVAYEAAGNTASGGTLSVTTPAPGALFSDSFETGDLSQWTTNAGMTAETGHAHTGAYGAEESSTGTATYAYKTLPGSYTLYRSNMSYVA